MTPSDIDDGNSSDLGAKAKHTARKLKESGQEVLSEAKDAVGGTIADIGAEAGARVEDAKARMAEQGNRMAESLREVSQRENPDSVQAKVLDSVASGIASASSTLRDTDVSQVMRSVQGFARRNPMLFAAGAAVTGLVIARVLAGSLRSDDRYEEEERMASGGPRGYAPRPSGAGLNGAMGWEGAGSDREPM